MKIKRIISLLILISFLFTPIQAHRNCIEDSTLQKFTWFSFGLCCECWKLELNKINIAYLGAFWSLASLCKFTPDLYIKDKNEGYAILVERRINTLKFVLENPNEDQLNSLKHELTSYYNEILENRALLSKIA